MMSLRPLAVSVLLACITLALTSCVIETDTRTESRAPRRQVALLLISEGGQLTAGQLQARRDEVLRYITERGLLLPDDELNNDLAAADRIIRAVIGDAGGFKLSVFTQGGLGGGDTRRVYWLNTSPDPFYDAGYLYRGGPDRGYYPYEPRELPRSPNPHAPPHGPRPDTPPPSNPPATPPDARPPHHRHPPDARDDAPRPSPRPYSPDTPRHEPRHPRDNPTDRPPQIHNPPPSSPPAHSEPREPSKPAPRERDEKREDVNLLPER